MEKFTASNGVEILESGFDREELPVMSLMCREREDVIMSERQFPAHHWDALREFFRHERDEELGRWRDPMSPEVVVTEIDHERVHVYNEATRWYSEFDSAGQDRVHLLTSGDYGLNWHAIRYFTAHPVSKPWHDAKPGEVWALLLDGRTGELACWVTQGGPDFEPIYGDDVYATIARGSQRITAARRIWPEASNA